MPPVSEKQRKAMHAAAEGESTLGIPRSVGREFVGGDGVPRAAGVMCQDEKGRVLFLKRAVGGDHAGTWCFPGGMATGGETPSQAAIREFEEETGNIPLVVDSIYHAKEPVEYVTHYARGKPFIPTLNDENVAFSWAPLDSPPEPLHPGVKEMLERMRADTAHDGMALDEASVRKKDPATGHMSIAMTPISKADVNPYKGKEINVVMSGRDGWTPLEDEKIYYLLRPADELEKAAASFAGKPLLVIHKPVNAADHPHRIVAGAVGTDVRFEEPYLKAPLTVWTAEAIALIEADEQKELSSGYHYTAEMTPGEFKGKHYDGVMRGIRGNHVALVREGRAGSDVAVGDSMENLKMAKPLISRKALLLQGALMAAFPKIAQDSKIDLGPALAGVTSKNFTEKKGDLLAGLKKQLGGIAQDADLEAIGRLIDAVEGQKVDDPDEADAGAGAAVDPDDGDTGADADAGMENALVEKVKAALEGVVPPEKLAEVVALVSGHEAEEAATGVPAEDEDDQAAEGMDQPGKKDQVGKDKRMAKDKDLEPKDAVSKTAMDAALKSTADSVKKQMREVRAAEIFVQPWLGTLSPERAVACDSAADVYKLALEQLGVKTEGVHPSAFRTILDLQPKPGDKARHETRIAQDERIGGDAAGFAEMFPEANRIGVSG